MSKIWFGSPTIAQINERSKKTMMEALDIEMTAIGDDFLEARMPVGPKTCQIYGILHGGASVTLAETLGSLGAYLSTDPDRYLCVGVDINANHLRPVKHGYVIGRATPIQRGKSLHVWEIKITQPDGKLVCISRLTVAVKEKQPTDV